MAIIKFQLCGLTVFLLVTILGQRRNALGHGHTLAAGLLAVNPILGLYYDYRHKGSPIEGGMIIAGSTLLDPYRIKLHIYKGGPKPNV